MRVKSKIERFGELLKTYGGSIIIGNDVKFTVEMCVRGQSSKLVAFESCLESALEEAYDWFVGKSPHANAIAKHEEEARARIAAISPTVTTDAFNPEQPPL